MENAQLIRSRIHSIRDTQKITGAMYLISSNKLRRARRELEQTRPYFEALKRQIGWLIRHAPQMRSPFLVEEQAEPKQDMTAGYLVVTADKGLAGAYNHNVLKQAEERMATGAKSRLYVVGEYGRQYLRRKGAQIEKSFLYTALNPTMNRAREIGAELIDEFLNGDLDEVWVVYTDMRSSMVSETKLRRLLPFQREYFMSAHAPDELEYEFSPSPREVMDGIIPIYVAGYIYSVLVDSFCSEQNARMMAMDAAGNNAEEMLRALSIQYNSVRQAAITREITEIAGGARAQRRGRER